MANFPEEAQPQSPLTGSENILAAKAAANGAVMIYITPSQLKEFIGTGVPINFFDSTQKVNISFMPSQRLSQSQFQQLTVNNVKGDIEHNMDWFNAAVRAVGSLEGWGTGTPAVQLGSAVITLGARTENSIAFSWAAVANAASYDIYKAGVKIANVSTTSYTSTGLTASTSYGHYVRSVPASGTNYTTGPASNTLTASTTAATGLPTPTAPTITFNESARTLGAIHASYVNGLERRYNGGAWENAADTASVYVGNAAVSANTYEWRVKAVSGTNLAGNIAGNTAIAAEVPAGNYTGLITGWEAGDGAPNVVISSNNITFNANQRARNNKVLPGSTNGGLRAVVSTYGAAGFGPNDDSMAGRNEMHFGFTKEGNGKITFFSLGTNLFETPSAPAAGSVAGILVLDGKWIGTVNGVAVDSPNNNFNAIAGSHKVHAFGSDGGQVNDVQTDGFA
jgi:hypothetical protein